MKADHQLWVCIVTHNRPDLLAKVLERIGQSPFPPSYAGMFVAENGGSEESQRVVGALPGKFAAQHMQCSSPSKSAALNAVLEKIDRGLIVFTDDDTEPATGWLSAYGSAYAHYGSGYYFGGPTSPDYDIPPPAWLLRFLPPSAAGFGSGPDGPRPRPGCFLGFNWAADAESLRRSGGFSRRFGPGTEQGAGDETLMQFQLDQQGLTPVFVSEAHVKHYVPAIRCSTTWSHKREASGAFMSGILYEWYQRHHSKRTTPWRSAVRRMAKSSKVSDIARLLTLRPAGIYWSRRACLDVHCFVRGVAYAKRHRPLDTDQWLADGLGNSRQGPAESAIADSLCHQRAS